MSQDIEDEQFASIKKRKAYHLPNLKIEKVKLDINEIKCLEDMLV